MAGGGLKARLILLIVCVATLVAVSLAADHVPSAPPPSDRPTSASDPSPRLLLSASESRTTETSTPSTSTADG